MNQASRFTVMSMFRAALIEGQPRSEFQNFLISCSSLIAKVDPSVIEDASAFL